MKDRYSAHVAMLALEHQVTVTEKTGTSGRAWGRSRQIRIAPVRGPVSYAVALHELGHVIAPCASGRRYPRLQKELRAWLWAREHAIEWTDRMDKEMQRSIGIYLDRARRRRWPIPQEIYQYVEG
jgi:hypothetical protein